MTSVVEPHEMALATQQKNAQQKGEPTMGLAHLVLEFAAFLHWDVVDQRVKTTHILYKHQQQQLHRLVLTLCVNATTIFAESDMTLHLLS
jgi:hypothetical protein